MDRYAIPLSVIITSKSHSIAGGRTATGAVIRSDLEQRKSEDGLVIRIRRSMLRFECWQLSTRSIVPA